MILSNIAERLSELIFDAGLNAVTLAEKIGVGRYTVYHYLSGARMPSSPILIKIADYFNCTTDYLVGLENESYGENFLPCPPFKERVPYLCKRYGISRYRLQKKTGLSESVLYYWARGESLPTVENAVRVAEALGCTLDFVFGRTNI